MQEWQLSIYILRNDAIPVYLVYLISMVKGAKKKGRKDIILMINTIWLGSILRVNSCFTKSVKFDEETNYVFIVKSRRIRETVEKYSKEP